jgi:hypothetical protein
MSHIYTPTGRITGNVRLPDDGEALRADTFNPAFESIAEHAAYGRASFVRNFRLQPAAGTGTFTRFASGRTNLLFSSADTVGERFALVCAAADNGIYSSYDGELFESAWLGDGAFQDLVYSEPLSLWAAVGVSIRTSDGSYDWTLRTHPAPSLIRGVAVGADGAFVAVGDSVGGQAYLLYSDDGITWEQQPAPIDCTLYAVCYGQERFIAVGGIGGVAHALASEDGLTWNEVALPALNAALRGVCFNGQVFAAVSAAGEVVVSQTGYSWALSGTALRGNGQGGAIAADPLSGAILVTAGDYGQLIASFDNGATFTVRTAVSRPSPVLPLTITGLGFADGRFMVGATDGLIATGLKR